MNEVRPGTTWQVHVNVTDRGQAMKLYIDGTLIADGTEVKDEPSVPSPYHVMTKPERPTCAWSMPWTRQ